MILYDLFRNIYDENNAFPISAKTALKIKNNRASNFFHKKDFI